MILTSHISRLSCLKLMLLPSSGVTLFGSSRNKNSFQSEDNNTETESSPSGYETDSSSDEDDMNEDNDDTDADEDTDIDVVIDEYRSSSSLATISLSSVDHRGQAFSSRYFKKCFIHLFGIFDTLSFT